jgi:gas vesicle protein
MDDRNNLPYFLLGMGVGLAVGLLVAPKSGEETRALLKSRAEEGRDYMKRKTSEIRETATDFVERGKDAVLRQREQILAAVEAGRQAYRAETGPDEA